MAAGWTSPRFLSADDVEEIRRDYGSPTFVYDVKTLRDSASEALAFPQSFGLTVRYAMKASPNATILMLFDSMGLHFDASSGYEARRAILAGVAPSKISISTQELPINFGEFLQDGVEINACSISQLERIGQTIPGASIGIRFNPGLGSGGTGKTNVGGPSSSFGIWHELIPEVKAVVEMYQLNIIRIHTHIGSGSDPAVWQKVSGMSLDIVRQFPSVTTLNLGGGYKVGRMSYEKSTDLVAVGAPVKEAFEAFANETGRRLHLEIEPGTFLVANAGCLVCTIQDMTRTLGNEGHEFLKLDTGMTELLRPSLYGSQHPVSVLPRHTSSATSQYVVVGHCCESGDLVTPAPDQPEVIGERVTLKASIGDACVIDGTGAYCSGMSTKNYNSFPEAAEVIKDLKGHFHPIRKRQELEQIIVNEVRPSGAALLG
eukprot:CAMPEP_0184684898 /NCGR_PEP_ID=MMETSP0312-20130426/17056_1 /TAXON_ID=31354 /ORGANISM="Compsopogon coeruleus, Strain SAG 36.94" /LENGTH=429 /DNA_ID=CAMNT_0027138523 /DNA_START=203 /DNA_END=1492 /DNA_ORIENTATION=-